MIPLHHVATGPTGAQWSQLELRTKDLVIILERHDGSLRDEAVVPEQSQRCSAFRYVLDGPLVARGASQSFDLRPGDALVAPTPGLWPLRSLAPSTTVLNIGWRRNGLLGAGISHQASFRPGVLAKARLLALADALLDGAPLDVSRPVVQAALAALRADGLPFPPDDVVAEACLARANSNEGDVARVVERVSSTLSAQPTSVDTAGALDVGAYHSLRRIKAFLREFYVSVGGWRDYLQLRRLQLGALFVGHPDARTETVARALGFRSPTSFCHAFHAAGLPSPREVQRLLLQT